MVRNRSEIRTVIRFPNLMMTNAYLPTSLTFTFPLAINSKDTPNPLLKGIASKAVLSFSLDRCFESKVRSLRPDQNTTRLMLSLTNFCHSTPPGGNQYLNFRQKDTTRPAPTVNIFGNRTPSGLHHHPTGPFTTSELNRAPLGGFQRRITDTSVVVTTDASGHQDTTYSVHGRRRSLSSSATPLGCPSGAHSPPSGDRTELIRFLPPPLPELQ